MSAAIVLVGIGVGLGFGLGSAASGGAAGSSAGNGKSQDHGSRASHGRGARHGHARGAGTGTTGTTATGLPGGAGQPVPASDGCGGVCVSLNSRKLGNRPTINTYIPDGVVQGSQAGRKINMQAGADRLPTGDFTQSLLARVSVFCGTDPHDFFAPGSYVCTHDGSFWAIEAEWSPYGNSSGLCAGVATANPDQTVILRPCGVSAHTLWIMDLANGIGRGCRMARGYCPWMNASDHNFRNPLVLTVDASTSAPADLLRIEPEQMAAGGSNRAADNQQFGYFRVPVG